MELPLTGNSQTAPSRRPKMAVNFAAPGDSGGGLLDSVSGVAAAAGIDLSSDKVDPWQRSVTTIISESYLAPHVDQSKIVLVQDSQSPPFNLLDNGDIQLGYHETELSLVFTGTIVGIENGLEGQAALTICNGGFRLAQMRTDQSFEQQSAGDIVQSLADLAEVETDTIDAGVDLPFYVVDGSLNLYQHIAQLAEKSGLLASISGEGKLNFKGTPAAPAEKTFNYGVDIVHLTLSRTTPPVDQVRLVGAGAAGSQGSDAWSWLIKDPQPVTASVGDSSSSRTRLLIDPSLRSSEGVQQASAGKLFFAKQQGVKAKLTVIGVAEIRAGSKIEIAGVPQAELNGTAIVESVRHHFSKDNGFVSEIKALLETGDSLDSLLSSALGSLGGLL